MEENIQKIVALIQESPLDQTVKEILIRDLEAEGLTDFLREQIEAYCTDGIEKLDNFCRLGLGVFVDGPGYSVDFAALFGLGFRHGAYGRLF